MANAILFEDGDRERERQPEPEPEREPEPKVETATAAPEVENSEAWRLRRTREVIETMMPRDWTGNGPCGRFDRFCKKYIVDEGFSGVTRGFNYYEDGIPTTRLLCE